MTELKLEECCLENKQSTVASCSSVSEGGGEGGGSAIRKSPGICSPTSPPHRLNPLGSSLFSLLY